MSNDPLVAGILWFIDFLQHPPIWVVVVYSVGYLIAILMAIDAPLTRFIEARRESRSRTHRPHAPDDRQPR
jgi:hypothetical protein